MRCRCVIGRTCSTPGSLRTSSTAPAGNSMAMALRVGARGASSGWRQASAFGRTASTVAPRQRVSVGAAQRCRRHGTAASVGMARSTRDLDAAGGGHRAAAVESSAKGSGGTSVDTGLLISGSARPKWPRTAREPQCNPRPLRGGATTDRGPRRGQCGGLWQAWSMASILKTPGKTSANRTKDASATRPPACNSAASSGRNISARMSTLRLRRQWLNDRSFDSLGHGQRHAQLFKPDLRRSLENQGGP